LRISILEWSIPRRGGRQITFVDGFADCFAELRHQVKIYSNYLNRAIPRERILDYFLAENLTLDNFDFSHRISRRSVEGMPIDEWSDGDMLLIPYPAYSWLGEHVECPIVCWFIAQPVSWYPSYVARIWTNSYTTKRRLELDEARVVYAPHDYSPFRDGAPPFEERPIDVLMVGPITKTREETYQLSKEVRQAERLKEMGLSVIGVFTARSRGEVKLARGLSFETFLNIRRRYVAEFMKKAKILFHPSPLESCSLVIFEALNAGMYPVVREAGACREQMGEAGFIYREFSEAVRRIRQVLREGYDTALSIQQGLKFDRRSNIHVVMEELERIAEL